MFSKAEPRRINRREWIATVLGASAAAALPQRPNVLFIIADDLNTSLGCYGHPIVKTPSIDTLARRGVLFENAYCQFPLCQPSRTSLLSGLRPESTKVWTLDTPTRQSIGDAIMLPELFRRNGYFSAHAGKVFHTGKHAEDPRSWNEEKREFGKNPPQSEIIRSGTEPDLSGHTFRWDVLRTPDEATPDGMVAAKTVEWLEQRAKDKHPFFLATGFRRPHAPYSAPQKYFDLYPTDRIPLPPEADRPPNVAAAINHSHSLHPLTPKVVREHIAAYYACVSFVDAQVGVVLNALDRLQLRQNTIVAFLGDHGYHLGDHGGLWHKRTLFEASARAPLMMAVPGITQGTHCKRIVEFVDIYPTLAHLCHLNPPANLEGLSFAPLLRNPDMAWKTASFTLVGRRKDDFDDPNQVDFLGRTIRTDHWRYTEWDNGERGVELYHLDNDPREIENLAGTPDLKSVQNNLAKRLHQGWRAALPQ